MLVIFDVEGVLYDEEYLPILAEKINKEKEIWEITKKGIQGKIDWEQGLRTRIDALRGIDERTCRELAESLPIMTGAREACRALKAAGWRLMAVSGGFTIMMERLQKELGLDYIFSNELVFSDGKLDGVRVNVDADKSKSARIKIAEWGERKEDIVCVVDGAKRHKALRHMRARHSIQGPRHGKGQGHGHARGEGPEGNIGHHKTALQDKGTSRAERQGAQAGHASKVSAAQGRMQAAKGRSASSSSITEPCRTWCQGSAAS